jgi:hypothetical protein
MLLEKEAEQIPSNNHQDSLEMREFHTVDELIERGYEGPEFMDGMYMTKHIVKERDGKSVRLLSLYKKEPTKEVFRYVGDF